MGRDHREVKGAQTRVVEKTGETLAALVREVLGVSWNKAKEFCSSGRVTIDGNEVSDGARRLVAGERVAVNPSGRKRTSGVLRPEDLLHLDADVVVVRKRAGVLTVPYASTDRDTLVDQTRAALRRQARGRQSPELGVVQRLDKQTSGVLVFARNLAAKRNLEQQFRVHSITRRYLALVHGHLGDMKIETDLISDRGDGLRGSLGKFRRAQGPVPRGAQRAVTHVRVLQRLAGASLVECSLETGRQHQIRIHVSETGHPLVGETVYIRDYEGPRIAAERPMLHAWVLGFDHPRTGTCCEFNDGPPPDFEECLLSLGGSAVSTRNS